MSKIKIIDFDVESSNPFKNCVLNREQYGKTLTSIIDSYPDGFVLALNNKWGEGKTTFLRMWQQSLNNLEYRTIYFNAWENDFEDNPLIAIMGELQSLKSAENKELYDEVVNKAAKIVKNVAPALLKALAAKYVDSAVFLEAVKNTSEALSESFAADVESYSSRKKGIAEFRSSLEKFVVDESNGKTLVFIIDELDRCRPSYSVTLLEQIKHLFTVPNIAFVLSVDKIQLGYAIKGVYGSENIDSDEYLRRFIDLEFSLPKPEVDKFYLYLYEYFDCDRLLRNVAYSMPDQNHRETLIQTCSLLFNENIITLRQQEKIFSHFCVALRSYDERSMGVPSLLFILIFIKSYNPSLYADVKSRKISVTEFQKGLLKNIKIKFDHISNLKMITIEAYICVLYGEYLELDRGIFTYTSQLNIDNSLQSTFTYQINTLYENSKIRPNTFKYLLDKSELAENFY